MRRSVLGQWWYRFVFCHHFWPSCHCDPVRLSFFCRKQKMMFWKMSVFFIQSTGSKVVRTTPFNGISSFVVIRHEGEQIKAEFLFLAECFCNQLYCPSNPCINRLSSELQVVCVRLCWVWWPATCCSKRKRVVAAATLVSIVTAIPWASSGLPDTLPHILSVIHSNTHTL